VRKGPVSSRVALLLRSAEGKPSFASISQYRSAAAVRGMVLFFFAFFVVRRLQCQRVLGRVIRAEGVPWATPGQAGPVRGRRRRAERAVCRGGGQRAPAGSKTRLPALEEVFVPGFYGWLACPGGKWSVRCLPWRRSAYPTAVLRRLACPGEGWSVRCLPWRRFSAPKSCVGLPALEESGPCAACLGRGLLRLSPMQACLPWKR
jgi:hypothetical protein